MGAMYRVSGLVHWKMAILWRRKRPIANRPAGFQPAPLLAAQRTPFLEGVGLLDGGAFAPRDGVGGDEVLILRWDGADEVVSASNMV